MQIKTLAVLAIVPTLFTAPQIVSVENLASVGWASPAEAGPTLNEGVRLNRNQITNRRLRKNVVTPRLRRRCPDPAIIRISAINHSPGTRPGTRNLRIIVVLKNVGSSRYKSRLSQQKLIVKRGNRQLASLNWPGSREVLMNPGAQYYFRAYFFRNWNPNPGEFYSNFSAQLVYDPDIRRDGNPENDDCRNYNNRKTITDAQLKRQLRL